MPKQVTLTETEWQHIYELLQEDSRAQRYHSGSGRKENNSFMVCIRRIYGSFN